MKKSGTQLLKLILESVFYSLIMLLIAKGIGIFLHKPLISPIPGLVSCFIIALSGKLVSNK